MLCTWSARGTCTSKWKAVEEWLRPLALARAFAPMRRAAWWSGICWGSNFKRTWTAAQMISSGNLQRWDTETVMEGSRWCSLDVEKNRFKPWLHQTPHLDWCTEKGKANCEETPRCLWKGKAIVLTDHLSQIGIVDCRTTAEKKAKGI